jgi:transposase
MAELWCGIDWAEKHHDVAVIDDRGSMLISERISDDVAGFDRLVELILELRKDGLDGLPVAIETAQGLLVSAIRAAGADVFAINPLSVSRYRDRYSPSRTKSDATDAMVLANILRTDRDNHRRLPTTVNKPNPSRCWPGPIRTRSGIDNRSPARHVPFSANTFRHFSKHLTT